MSEREKCPNCGRGITIKDIDRGVAVNFRSAGETLYYGAPSWGHRDDCEGVPLRILRAASVSSPSGEAK